MLAEEIISLSCRAESVTKELEALNETVQREMSQLGSIFDSMQSAIVSIKTSLLDNGAESGKIESYIGQIESLSHYASTVISELNGDQNKLAAMLIGESGSEPVSVILKSLESGFSNLGRSLEELRDASNEAGRDPMNDPAESFYRGQDPRIVQDLTEPPAYDATTIQREN
jgi:methyl-accepting chemotaxis protein